MKIKFILNPTAGIKDSTKCIEKVVKILGSGSEVNIQFTQKRYDAFYIAKQAAGEDYDAIIGGGGDGTINQVVNGLMSSGKPVTAGFIPLGTSNAYAMSLGIPSDPIRASEIILDNHTREVDLGRTNSGSGYYYFINMAGAGFDAQTVGSVNPKHTKYLGGIVAHIIAGARSIFTSSIEQLHVEVDGEKHDCYQVFIFNGMFYGGFIKAAPLADMTDGYLDVYLFRKGSKGDVVRYFSGVIGRYHTRMKDVDHFQAKHIKVNASEEVLVHLDGEVIGTLPREFDVHPKGMRVLVPK